MDFLSLSKGGKFEDAKQPKVGEAAYPYTGPSGYECMPTVISDARGPFGRNVPLAAAIRGGRARRRARHARWSSRGGIATFEQAEGILARGEADVVAAARQSARRPRLVPQDAAGPRRRGPPLRVHQLLRGRSTSGTSR